MGQTTFTGPVVSGDQGPGTPTPNQGFALLEQQIGLATFGAAGSVDSVLYIPAGSIITGFTVDVLTASNNGTIAITYTAAQLAAMAGVTIAGVAAPTPTLINFRVTSVGTTGTAGYAVVTVQYAQLISSYS